MKFETFSEKLFLNPNKGALCLVPTPLEEDGRLDPMAFDILKFAALEKKSESLFVIEDLKPGRKRWLHFGLPRECVDDFVLYNEHTASEVSKTLLSEIQKGKKVFLMSDGGTPAFYDPGVELVKLCHQNKQFVTSTPLENSVALALALSGFSHKKFWFEGFLPMDASERKSVLTSLLKQKHTSILMDTPYRMKRVLEEFSENWSGQGVKTKKIFLAMDLCSDTEELRVGTPSELLGAISDYKREFVLVLSE
jgi:16S rRNA (cytidine1402-2'-O)-methyltransferase